MVEDMLSADDVSCSSSQVSAKSEKNMADFDGEESGCEEELAQINSHAELSSHLQQHLPNLASIYHEHLVQPAVHKHQYSSHAITDINLDNVCKKGNTLLWDLVQDEDAIHLSEGLINEAEKLLCSLVCWFTDRQIRMRFIEGCLDNLAHHSVVVSLRLLPKLFGTFQQFGSSYDTHWITWAEKELHMMKLFFDDLQHYIQEVRENLHKFAYGHSAEVQVRLQFLTCVFSTLGSPDHFLSLEQVDILWHCLVEDAECYDDALHWFLNQVRSKDQHAMGMETYKHLFLEKMPQLKPETISMTGLNLFQHLCNLARLATSTLDNTSSCELCGMDQLWGIALRAQSADISRAAIQYINSYYMNKTGLEKEQEFIRKCMESLLIASANLEKDAHSSLTSIERGLLMLKTHLEAFRRFAYHLRQWQIEGTGISSHLKALNEKQSLPLRIVCQPAGLPDKMTIEMYPSDQVADLRAEVTHWYENLQKEQMNQQAQLQEFGQSGRQTGDFPGLMGPVRMISSGHELTTDYDEKTLHELGFKDMQMVFVSLGAPRRERKGEGVQLPASCLPPPQKEHIPMLLLLQEPHLTTLFDLLEMLACFKPPIPNTETSQESPESQRCEELHLHAENLSRRVWELLMLLPTCPKMLQAFQNISDETEGLCWKELLRIKSPHKLLYALEIIEALGKPNRRIHRESTGSYSDLYPDSDDSSEDQIENSKNTWSCKFVSSGGLQLLLEIFNSGILEPKDQESWTWQLDCLACLLKLICQFAVDPADLDLAYHDVFSWSGLAESQRKRAWPGKSRKSTVDHGKGLHIPRLTEVFLSLVQGTNLIQRLINVAYTYDNLGHVLKAQSDHRSRHETHYSMWLLVSWAHCSSTVKSSLADSDHLHDWLRKLTLLVPEPAVRHEACNGLYKLSLSGLEGGESINRSFLLLAASTLLKFLPDAQALKPLRQVEDYEEEPLLRTGCKEYFWLLCKLIDNIHVKDASREILDQQDGATEDDGLTGLLRLATSVLKHKPPFKLSCEGQEFLRDVYNLLFLLPSLADRAQPKCKSHAARAAAYDLLVEVKGSVENYRLLHNWVMSQHMQSHAPYKWDYWPHDDVRAECRFVGLTNLGATCYLASTIQQLYMIPEARQAVFTAKYSEEIKHKTTLLELQKMFTYLMESERKAYNPRPFCKTYTMDKQPLNTGEQKDMTEFFTDLITKIEEMSLELKNTVKTLFGGVITNNVVSLLQDCDHVSQTAEEFYTVRCQVADMKNIYESLDEVTIKDTLEGDNMYTCSQCGKKVRAEKACFKKLPRILSFNTMRYTFNMVTMMKEKVNTHFSFPLRLDMTSYTEDFLMGKGERKDFREERKATESYEYDLIGVTVHTGTADGGHYYSFIRDIINPYAHKNNKRYLFNDAEVKPFDSAQLASECFGGEMTTKTYDSVTDKFMDFSFEKTHSAYMLFYKRVELEEENGKDFSFDVSPDLLEWIWHDNMQFLQDKNIFEHTYFFMWQLCSSIPSTLPDPKAVSLMTAKLSTSFVLETFIHSKEKPTMLQWIELLTKQFNNSQAACEWFLDRMADDNWWPMQILIKCPNQIVRQMFQRLCIHVIQRLRPVHAHLYLQPGMEDSDDMDGPVEDIGSRSCVTRFVKTLLSIMEHGVKPHSKHLTEYFAFLYEFAKMGEEESQFLLSLQAISIMVHFYMGTKGPENPQVEVLSEEEAEEEDEEEDILSLAEEKYRPAALEKMIALIALLVEQSRSEHLTLSQSDMAALTGGKGFPFLFQHIRDGINIRQTCNLIFSLCRYNNRLAEHIVSMLFTSIAKLTPEAANPFFKLLTMLMEFAGGPPGMPSFASYILQRIWEVIEYNPSQCLDWLAVQTPRNKLAHSWVLQNMENWVERFLLAHNYPRVRTAAYLLVSLIPSNSFRQMFRSTRSLHLPTRELPLSPDTTVVLHQVYNLLLGLLGRAKLYVDASVHGTTKLMQYFSFMTYCLISKTEKLMFSGYFMDLWNLFQLQPKLSEPAIATNHNKQALLSFWYNVCVDCPENVRLVVQNPVVTKNIAFNYILADHDDQEVVLFNRGMLPAYYGILRLCCEQSPAFTRQLASHQNIQWAFKNLTPHASQYPGAVEELFNLMQLFVAQRPDMREEELEDIKQFKKTTISCYLRCLDGRSCWTTLIAFRVLLENDEDRLLVVFNRGLILMTELQSFNTLHMMYHEATACHVTGDLVELLSIFLSVLKSTRPYLQRKDVKQALIQWQERIDFAHKLLTLLNSYSPPELRNACLVLKELVLLSPHDFLHTLVPFLQHNHCTYHHSNIPSFGPYLPCRENIKLMGAKNNIRPPRPELNMCLLPSLVESSKQGKDEAYDRMLLDYFLSYHQFIHLLCRVAINCEKFTDTLVKLVLIAYEGLPLHLSLFPKLWTELCQSSSAMAKTCVKLLCEDPAFSEYIKCILMDERTFLNNNVAYSFLTCFMHKVQVLSSPSSSNLIGVLVTNLLSEQSNLQPELAAHHAELNKTSSLLNADLRALVLLLSVQPPQAVDPALSPALQELLTRCRLCIQQRSTLELEVKDHKSKAEDEGATPVKRRRMSSDDDAAADGAAPLCVASTSSSSALPTCGDAKADHQEALTPTSTSDTETRDSSSLIDPGTEQDPPSPDSNPATSGNLDSSPKEEKMEASSSSSSFSSSSSSLMQEAGEGFVQGEEPEPQRHVGTAEEHGEEAKKGAGTSTSADEEKEKEAGSKAGISPAPPQLEETTLPSAMGLVGEGPESCSSHASSAQMSSDTPDMLDMLYRTVDAAIAIVTKLSTKGPPSS
uniref:Ubiquitin carboxyl-terminal hydrolase 34 n=1 Tax=Oryzias latipes TaxID=8090 RepID=A0A3P9L1X7_ORYLA